MNIFILHEDAREAARAQCDKHVPKMFLESLQLLCNVVPEYLRDVAAPLRRGAGLFKPTHLSHPCARWVAASAYNWAWLLRHAETLHEEYADVRFKRAHASVEVLKFIHKYQYNIRVTYANPHAWLTPFVQVVPEEYREEDPVNAYRRYYRHTKTFAKYERGRPPPLWWDCI